MTGFKSILFLSWICLGSVHAACNNPANWLESPKDGVKVLIGYEQDLGARFASQPTSGLDTPAFAPPLPQGIQTKDGEGTLSKDEDKGVVSYYEPDGKDSWRICRKEDWFRRSESTRPAVLPELKRTGRATPASHLFCDRMSWASRGSISTTPREDFEKRSRRRSMSRKRASA